MKIVFFTNEYSHPKLPSSGGVGSFLKTMSETMTKQSHEVHIYGFSKRKIEFQEGKISIKFFKKYAKQFPFSEFLRSLSGKLKIKNTERYFLKKERQYLAKQLKIYCVKNNIDIIESFVFNGFTAYWDNSTPLVLRFHGSRGFWHYYLDGKKDVHKIFMEQKALESTPNLVAVSKFSAEAVKKIYNIDIDKVIYNGIDAEQFVPKENSQIIEKSIFYFGTISKAKGLDTLCTVFNHVIEKFPNASLHLIGRGQDYWEYISKSVLSANANKQTTYYGSKQLTELANIIQSASLFIFPSLNETFGLIVTEAMALEKPVITSDIQSFNEIIDHKHNGFISKNVEDYLNYISLLFEDPNEAQRISINARQKVLSNFTKEKMIENSLTYYNTVLYNKTSKN